MVCDRWSEKDRFQSQYLLLCAYVGNGSRLKLEVWWLDFHPWPRRVSDLRAFRERRMGQGNFIVCTNCFWTQRGVVEKNAYSLCFRWDPSVFTILNSLLRDLVTFTKWLESTICVHTALVMVLIVLMFNQGGWCLRTRPDGHVVQLMHAALQGQVNKYAQMEAVKSDTPSFRPRYKSSFDVKKHHNFAA